MVEQKLKTARAIAVKVLNQFDHDKQRSYVAQILDKFLPQTSEKQRATDLVFGCIRNRVAIDMVVGKLADCLPERIPGKLINIIRIAAYELIFNPAAAEYAVVNEAVENAKAVSGKKAVNFVNAVLRQIARSIDNRRIPLTQADIKKTLPQNLSTGCQFNTQILPDPEKSPVDYYSMAFSLPLWLVQQWLSNFGQEKLRQICFASNRRPSIYLRPNTLKTSIGQLADEFRDADIDFDVFEDSMLRVKSSKAITSLPGFEQGLFTVQDLTAFSVLKSLKFEPGCKILDLCAAPGTKTTQLAEITDGKAAIFATDIDSQRLQKLQENTKRLGIKSINIFEYEDLGKITAQVGSFDWILLDVPCSNTGVLAKRAEVRYRIKRNVVTSLAKTQIALIESAVNMLKPKGRILYSTCSIQGKEDCELVETFLNHNSDFTLEYERLTLAWPESFDHDGGYMAILEKI